MVEYTIKDLPKDDRPREKLRKHGPQRLTKSELLALVIRAGTQGKNVLDLSHQILSDFDFKHLSNSSVQELCKYDGIGEVKAGQILAVFELAKRFSKEEIEIGEKIESYNDVVNHFGMELQNLEREELRILHLSNSNELIAEEILSQGSIDEIPTSIREIVKSCVKKNSKGVILVHNHPGGKVEASKEDLDITERIAEALELIDVRLLDHIIFGKQRTASLKRQGHL